MVHSDPDRALQQDSTPKGVIATEDALDIFFLLYSGALVFFMHCGFCMLSAGSVRGKNAKNIILKVLLDACVGAIGWYIFGYAFAYGDSSNNALGTSGFALNSISIPEYKDWFFQYGFAATAATIVSGAVAERTRFEAYLLYAFFLTSWVYPNVVHWVWDERGWLSTQKVDGKFSDTGMIDFAGCAAVHMVGGLAGLAGAIVVGPRLGRFNANGDARDIPGHSASLTLLGVFILWFGWYGFNPGSALQLSANGALVAANSAVTTTLAAAGGCMSSLLMLLLRNFVISGRWVWDVIGAGNGTLAGLVGITASCSVVKPWAAIVIGLVAGCIYVWASHFVAHVMKVDDPLDAIAVHAFCGAWGLIAAAAFTDEDLGELAGYETGGNAFGFVMGGDGKLLAAAIVGIVTVTAWVLGHMVPFFFALKVMGLLRVSAAEEQQGLDVSHHGGSAYPTDFAEMYSEAMEGQLLETTDARLDLKSKLDYLQMMINEVRSELDESKVSSKKT